VWGGGGTTCIQVTAAGRQSIALTKFDALETLVSTKLRFKTRRN
jgi:hypothetical protein